jgi:hypothetical protein
MKKIMKILITTVLTTSLPACSTIPAAESQKLSATPSPAQAVKPTVTAFKIDLVDNSNYQYLDGCGCSFWPVDKPPKFNDSGTRKYLLVGNYEKQAWMNINDQIIELHLTKDTIKYQGNKGDRFEQTYQAGDITANVECIATGFGDTHAVDCDATITVIKGDQKQVVKAIGSCGC